MGIHLREDSETEELIGSSHNKLLLQHSSSSRSGHVTCASSSSYSSTPTSLWPQSFGRTMDIYSRSTSQRSQLNAEDQCCAGSEGLMQESSNCSRSASSTESERIIREPLLRNYCAATNDDLETADRFICGSVAEADGSSFFQAMFNGMNVLAGVGILSTPYAAAQGGWLGLTLLLTFAITCCYTAILLRRCMDSDDSLTAIHSYPDVGEAAFGKWGRWVTSILLYLELYAVAIEFLILEGDNLAQLFPGACISMQSLHIALDPHQVFVVASAMAMLPTMWLRELSVLSYVSAGGVVASVLLVAAVGWVGAMEGVGFNCGGALVHLGGLPVAVGLYSFCYCGHAVFPSIYGSMRHRQQFTKVLVICFVLCTLMYGGIAVMGYLMFGDALESQITLNLPREAPASHFAIWVTLVNPFAKYALTLTPIAVALEEVLPHSMSFSRKAIEFWGRILRTLLVISTVTVALTVPFFGLLMAFIGSFLSVAVSIHLPCLCYLAIFKRQLSRWETLLVGAILILGVFVGIVGTYFSVMAIVDKYNIGPRII